MKYLIAITFLIQFAFAQIFIGGIFDENEHEKKYFLSIIELLNMDRNENNQIVALTEDLTPNNPYEAMLKTCKLLEMGAITIFGPTNPDNFDAIQSVCDAKEVPLIQNRWNFRPLRDTPIINNYPHTTGLSQAFVDILRSWSWEAFTILYDDEESLFRLADVLKMAQDNTVIVTIKQLDPYRTGIYRSVLKEVYESGAENFVIDCKIERLGNILTQAQQVGLITQDFNFFITNLDMQTIDLESFQYSQANMTGVRLLDPEKNETRHITDLLTKLNGEMDYTANWKLKTGAALTIDAMTMLNTAITEIEKTSGQALKSKDMSCASTGSWEFGYSLVNIFKTTTHQGITGLSKFDNQGFRSDIQLEIISLEEGGISKIGTWNSSEGLKMNDGPVVEEQLEENESLANRSFTVILCLTEPYGYLVDSDKPQFGNERYEGFAVDLIKELAAMEKFNYTFIIRKDKSNGSKDPKTGEWNGMIGDLINKVADLAIADLTINAERSEAVDFTSPFMNVGIMILFQKSGKAPPNFFSFAEPFAIDTWGALALAYLIVSISLYIMGRLSADEWTNPFPCIEEPEFLVNQFSLQNSFWFSTGSLMQQGTEIAPIAMSTRMVAGMWWFFVLIMVAMYTANLAAFLATENPMKLFDDVNDLVENAEARGLRYGAKAKGATANFFEGSNNPVYQKVAKHFKNRPEDMVTSNEAGVSLAEEDKYAFFMESTSIEYVVERHCGLEKYGDKLDSKGYGIAMRRHSPYRSRLSTAVLKLQSTGVIDNLKRKWWEERRGGGQCQESGGGMGDATALDIGNVEGVFFVTIYGIIAGACFALIEKIFDIFRIRRRAKIRLAEAIKVEVKNYTNFESTVKPVIARRSKSQSGELDEEDDGKIKKESMENGKPQPYGFIIERDEKK